MIFFIIFWKFVKEETVSNRFLFNGSVGALDDLEDSIECKEDSDYLNNSWKSKFFGELLQVCNYNLSVIHKRKESWIFRDDCAVDEENLADELWQADHKKVFDQQGSCWHRHLVLPAETCDCADYYEMKAETVVDRECCRSVRELCDYNCCSPHYNCA